MLATVLAAFRDSLEALFLITALLTLVNRLGKKEKSKYVIAGALTGLVLMILAFYASILLGKSLESLIGNVERLEGIILISSGVMILLAVLIIEHKAKKIKSFLSEKMLAAAQSQSHRLVFLIPLLIVFNEGIEITITSSKALLSGNLKVVLIGTFLGLSGAFMLTALIRRAVVRLKITALIKVLSLVLVIISLSFVNHGIHELIEAGVLRIEELVFSRNQIINEIIAIILGVKGKISLVQAAITGIYVPIIINILKRTTLGVEKSQSRES